MALNLGSDTLFVGSALPGPFVEFELEKELIKQGLLPKSAGVEGQNLQAQWELYRRKLRELVMRGGAIRVRNVVLEPLVTPLGYTAIMAQEPVLTREGPEPGGYQLTSEDGASVLRAWCLDFDQDLDAPAKRGHAYRYSPIRIAERVLLAKGERVGILTNGSELRILLSDPARTSSQVVFQVDTGWKRTRQVPDSYRLLLALCSPKGTKAIPDLIDKARLQQTTVTRELRKQARTSVEGFLQEVLDHPANAEKVASFDQQKLAKELWHEGLVIIYRLLFILKLESSDDPARAFTFASTSVWRNTFSPTTALAKWVKPVLLDGADTGHLLEQGLRQLFRLFTSGLRTTELKVDALDGAFFGKETTPILDDLAWGERAVALLLDRLLWTETSKKGRQRVHYGPLDVEDLGRVYEALLELEPGIATEAMCRLRRQKLEVVVPEAQGQKYKPVAATNQNSGLFASDDEEEEEPEEEEVGNGKKTKVEWIERIPVGRFYLRVGLGRKSSGSYYTPESFVRFLVQETLGPQVEERSPKDNPNPSAILELNVLDPAMGSGHFLVGACRFLGDALYEACRLCDERASEAETRFEEAETEEERERAFDEALEYRRRIQELPDPDDEMERYMPSRSAEGPESGVSQRHALALAKRLVAVHCLYGVDKNPLAIELAKLALWIETHAEGMPLTFMDHRLVAGDSLTGPFFHHLLTYPGSGKPIQDLFAQGLKEKFTEGLRQALQLVGELEKSVGASQSDILHKAEAKKRLDAALEPFRNVAAVWAEMVMSGEADDEAYLRFVKDPSGDLPVEAQHDALPYDLIFPEVFFPNADPEAPKGFDAVIGNPPWEGIDTSDKEFFAAFDLAIFDQPSPKDEEHFIAALLAKAEVLATRQVYEELIGRSKRNLARVFNAANQNASGASAATPDLYQLFSEKVVRTAKRGGSIGLVLPYAIHANEGATGLRKLYLNEVDLKSCYSFENKKKLFEIDSRYRFDLIVGIVGRRTEKFRCCFYLKDPDWLFESANNEALEYSSQFVQATAPDFLNFLELQNQSDVQVTETCYLSAPTRFGVYRREVSILPTEELHFTKNKWRLMSLLDAGFNGAGDVRLPPSKFKLIDSGFLPFLEGKHFHQYTDVWESPPSYCIPIIRTYGKEKRLAACRFYRLAFRTVASSTNERSSVFSVLSPGVLVSHSGLPESAPHARSSANALEALAITNSFCFDYLLRLTVSANITFNFLDAVPVPRLPRHFAVHLALRLTCNHGGYEPLWREQLGDAWRESIPPFTWPVLEGDDARWTVRASIDAVVAEAYGLSRDQYEHVLSTFSHKSYKKASELCLAMFDELKSIGLEAFTRKHDPYWDIPLNENLPLPVIDLPVVAASAAQGQFVLDT